MRPPKASPKKDRPGWFEAKGIDPDTGKRRSYLARTPEEASTLALRSKSAASKPKHDGTLYGFYALTYLPTVAGHRGKTLKQIAWAFDGYILPALGHVQLTDLTRPMIQEQFNIWASSGLKGNSPRHLKTWLGAVVQLAVDDGLIDTNPVRRVRLPKVVTKKPKALDWPDLALLIEHSCPTLKPAVLLMACGLSPSETAAAEWSRLSPDNVFYVCQQVDQDRGEIVKTLKTDARYRHIPLPPFVVDQLRAGRRSNILICPNADGYLIMPKSFTKLLAEACVRAEIDRVNPYQLRHTFISLLENDVEAPRRVVQALAGHARGNVTDGYSHTFMRQLEKWMTAYWERVSSVVRQNKLSHEAENAG